jgi:tRNA A-37 threonylcarbamoyl transferase component Bud32
MANVHREAGDIIGGYTVVETLGRGGSGAVYKVRDQAGHDAALKLVDASADGIAARRLEREVHALQSLRHPAVPRVIDAELDDDQTFVVFELVPGVSLFYYIQEHGPLKGDELAAFAEATGSALEAVHKAGVVHRDVTPSNIMMGPAGPVLIDFGLSHRAEDERLTRDGLVSGTAGYVAPEVINGAEPGPIADRWAWAATVAFAMVGDAPYGSGTGAIGRTLEAAPQLPDVVGAHAVAAALSRDISERPDMRAVVAALRGATEMLARLPRKEAQQAMEPTLMAPGGTAVMDIYDDALQDVDADGYPLADELEVGQGEDADAWQGGQHDVTNDDGAEEWADGANTLPTPPARRTFTIALWTVAVSAVAAVAPMVSIGVLIVAAVISRALHRRAVALHAVRVRRGARRGDGVVQTIGLPWHLLRGAGEIVPAIILAALAGSGVTALTWWLVSTGQVASLTSDGEHYGYAASLALGAGTIALVLWWGPWMSGTRDGARRLAWGFAPTPGVAGAWIVVALVGLGVTILAVYFQFEPWWWPLPSAPTGPNGPLAGN